MLLKDRIAREEAVVAVLYRVFLVLRVLFYLGIAGSLLSRVGFIYATIYLQCVAFVEVIIYLLVKLLYEGKLHLSSRFITIPVRFILRFFTRWE